MSANQASPQPSPAQLPVGKSARSLSDLVAERLLQGIVAGRFMAGERLKEEALAREHAVSRATIREALLWLEKRRFVERIPRIGARVTGLDEKDVDALFEARAAVLGFSAARCAETGSEKFKTRLNALVKEMTRMAADPKADPRAYLDKAVLVQELIVANGDNRYLAEFFDQLANMSTWRLVRGLALALAPQERREQSARDWQSVARAISRRDAQAASQAVRALMEHSVRGAHAQLASRSAPPG